MQPTMKELGARDEIVFKNISCGVGKNRKQVWQHWSYTELMVSQGVGGVWRWPIYDHALLEQPKLHNCHSPNSTSTQAQFNSTELGLTWKWVCTPMKLNFHHKEPQTNLKCFLNSNISVKLYASDEVIYKLHFSTHLEVFGVANNLGLQYGIYPVGE